MRLGILLLLVAFPVQAEDCPPERYAILEYLKVHRDEPATPAGYQPPVCGP